MRRTGVSSGLANPASTTWPTNRVWSPRSTEVWTRQSTQATAWSRTGEPVTTASENGKPLRVRAARSTSTGLVNLRTIARSSRSTTHRAKAPPATMSSWVRASFSTLIPSSLGSELTWVAQFRVMALRRSPARLPTTYRPDGMVHKTRRRSLSYSSASLPSGTGPTIPLCTGTGADATCSAARRQILDSPGQVHVLGRDAALVVGRQGDAHLVVPDVQVGMVVRRLGRVGQPDHEGDGGRETAEAVLLGDGAVDRLPAGQGVKGVADLVVGKGRHILRSTPLPGDRSHDGALADDRRRAGAGDEKAGDSRGGRHQQPAGGMHAPSLADRPEG